MEKALPHPIEPPPGETPEAANRNAAETVQAGRPSASSTGTVERPGTVIGRYQLLGMLGRGGMGIVYRAEQLHPVRRQVALKLIKPGMDSEQAIVRFEAERQALALMDHSNIARVFDAGTTPAGRLYFVMELVEGIPLTKYCEENRLGLRARLQLFIELCHAIQHAHQKGIAHRDIKPSNALVTNCDGKPAVKVIDFGVAKAVTDACRLSDSTMLTAVGTPVGTYEYMSPEQAHGGLQVDTRSDIYSLGVLLYELLTGTTPLERASVRNASEVEIRRRIQDEVPPRPSARVGDHERSRELRGDLDWIAVMALEKDPQRRYATANEMAADIERFLEGEPIVARPPSTAYLMGKFARRYRAPLAAAAVFVMLLAGATAVSVTLAIRARQAETNARQERDRALAAERAARQERDRAASAEGQAARERDAAIAQSRRADMETAVSAAANRFLEEDVLAQASARQQLAGAAKADPDLKVRAALDRAATGIAGKFDAQPEVEASIRSTIGNAYLDLGLDEPAQQQLQRALDLDRRLFGAESPQAMKALGLIGKAHFQHRQYPEAEAAMRPLLSSLMKTRGPRDPETIQAASDLALIEAKAGKHAEAEKLAEEAARNAQTRFGAEHPLTLAALANLGNVYLAQDALPGEFRTPGIFPKAIAIFLSVLDAQRRVLGADHPDTLDTMTGLSTSYHRAGNYEQAVALEREIMAIRTRVWGPEHPSTLAAMANLAADFEIQQKTPEAEAVNAKLLEARKRVFGPDHPATLETMHNLAANLREHDPAAAEAMDEQILAIRRRTQGVENRETRDAMISLVADYTMTMKLPEAEKLQLELLDARRRFQGPDHPETRQAFGGLSKIYRGMGRFREAAGLDTTYLNQSVASNGPDNEFSHFRRMYLAWDYLFLHEYDRALELSRIAFPRLLAMDGWKSQRTKNCVYALAISLHALGKDDEAEPLLREALAAHESTNAIEWRVYCVRALLGAVQKSPSLLIEGYQGMVKSEYLMAAEERPFIQLTAGWLSDYYAAAGRPDAAAEWRAKAGGPK
jgi:non-specific serine/threonine protein kinase/serine/threonine-protein kinase